MQLSNEPFIRVFIFSPFPCSALCRRSLFVLLRRVWLRNYLNGFSATCAFQNESLESQRNTTVCTDKWEPVRREGARGRRPRRKPRTTRFPHREGICCTIPVIDAQFIEAAVGRMKCSFLELHAVPAQCFAMTFPRNPPLKASFGQSTGRLPFG